MPHRPPGARIDRVPPAHVIARGGDGVLVQRHADRRRHHPWCLQLDPPRIAIRAHPDPHELPADLHQTVPNVMRGKYRGEAIDRMSLGDARQVEPHVAQPLQPPLRRVEAQLPPPALRQHGCDRRLHGRADPWRRAKAPQVHQPADRRIERAVCR